MAQINKAFFEWIFQSLLSWLFVLGKFVTRSPRELFKGTTSKPILWICGFWILACRLRDFALDLIWGWGNLVVLWTLGWGNLVVLWTLGWGNMSSSRLWGEEIWSSSGLWCEEIGRPLDFGMRKSGRPRDFALDLAWCEDPIFRVIYLDESSGCSLFNDTRQQSRLELWFKSSTSQGTSPLSVT